MLLSEFKPKKAHENEKVIFDLSRGEMAYVNGMIARVNGFNRLDMIQSVYSKIESTEMTMEINRKLKSAMSNEDVVRFAEEENLFLKKKDVTASKLYKAQKDLEVLTHELDVKMQLKERIMQRIRNNAQNKHIYELSYGLSSMMTELLTERNFRIRTRLSELIVEDLKYIYRKNNLVAHVEITEDFQFNLYQIEQYTKDELLYLIKNLGNSAFLNQIGLEGRKKLFALYDVMSIDELKIILDNDEGAGEVSLYKKIELSRLSKGKRQIFILSLYWAIIILSGKEIPFIIDTPYARIDANHRKEISEKFFPNISKQVIILSTDEEINEEYYSILKPYISKEYLLVNDENQNKTSVVDHYFF